MTFCQNGTKSNSSGRATAAVEAEPSAEKPCRRGVREAEAAGGEDEVDAFDNATGHDIPRAGRRGGKRTGEEEAKLRRSSGWVVVKVEGRNVPEGGAGPKKGAGDVVRESIDLGAPENTRSGVPEPRGGTPSPGHEA